MTSPADLPMLEGSLFSAVRGCTGMRGHAMVLVETGTHSVWREAERKNGVWRILGGCNSFMPSTADALVAKGLCRKDNEDGRIVLRMN